MGAGIISQQSGTPKTHNNMKTTLFLWLGASKTYFNP